MLWASRSIIILDMWKKVKVLVTSHVLLFGTPWTVAHQAYLSMKFFRQEYWSRLSFPSPGDLPDPGIKPGSPAWQADSLLSELQIVVVSCQVVSNSARSHGLQHARYPCPSPSLGVCPGSRPLNWWCHPTISSSVALSSFCLHSFQASGSFAMSRVFASGGQNIGASVSVSVFPKSIQVWSPRCSRDF